MIKWSLLMVSQKRSRFVMLVPDQVRDDGSGIQSILESLDSGLRRNDDGEIFQTFYEFVMFI